MRLSVWTSNRSPLESRQTEGVMEGRSSQREKNETNYTNKIEQKIYKYKYCFEYVSKKIVSISRAHRSLCAVCWWNGWVSKGNKQAAREKEMEWHAFSKLALQMAPALLLNPPSPSPFSSAPLGFSNVNYEISFSMRIELQIIKVNENGKTIRAWAHGESGPSS